MDVLAVPVPAEAELPLDFGLVSTSLTSLSAELAAAVLEMIADADRAAASGLLVARPPDASFFV
jgi:hypothetical protein